jgi:hypothetical protein
MRNAEGARLDGFGEWADLSEALIRGMSHGLTNRISSISSFVTLHGMGDKEFTVDSFLPKEAGQLQQVARALRLLVIDAEVSALELAPIVRDAMDLYSHHSRMHAFRFELSLSSGPLMPVRVIRSSMLRLIVIMLDMIAAQAQQSESGDILPLSLEGTQQELMLRGSCRRAPTDYALSLAEEAGAALLSEDDFLILRIPTLVSLRAR